jgi:thiamine biosynthesis lipoprotein
MLRHVFRAMGTQVEALLEPTGPGGARELLAVESEFERLEAIMSRFRPGSDLSRLNEAGCIDDAPELAHVVELALEARSRTGGRFDPTVHDALVAAGYDRTFEEVEDAGSPGAAAPAGGGVRVDGDRVELDPGIRLDLGGIGKGYAVDCAVELLAPCGPCLVNAGGDLAVTGVPSMGPWAVAVETPGSPLIVGLNSGALATSGRDRRRWTRGGEEAHHLIDPASGRPADSPWLRVTVAAPSAVAAEVRAKDIFLGAEPADVDAVLVALDGSVTRTGVLA